VSVADKELGIAVSPKNLFADKDCMKPFNLWRPWMGSGLFVAVVVLPTAASALYYGAVASDLYISESRFVVRSPSVNRPGF